MQTEILEENLNADIEIYAIWFNMLPADDRSRWDPTLLTDPRADHYWDEDREVGRWYADRGEFGHGSIAWDLYYLYGPEAKWEEGPAPLLRSGYTIFGDREQLKAEILKLWGE